MINKTGEMRHKNEDFSAAKALTPRIYNRQNSMTSCTESIGLDDLYATDDGKEEEMHSKKNCDHDNKRASNSGPLITIGTTHDVSFITLTTCLADDDTSVTCGYDDPIINRPGRIHEGPMLAMPRQLRRRDSTTSALSITSVDDDEESFSDYTDHDNSSFSEFISSSILSSIDPMPSKKYHSSNRNSLMCEKSANAPPPGRLLPSHIPVVFFATTKTIEHLPARKPIRQPSFGSLALDVSNHSGRSSTTKRKNLPDRKPSRQASMSSIDTSRSGDVSGRRGHTAANNGNLSQRSQALRKPIRRKSMSSVHSQQQPSVDVGEGGFSSKNVPTIRRPIRQASITSSILDISNHSSAGGGGSKMISAMRRPMHQATSPQNSLDVCNQSLFSCRRKSSQQY